MRLPKKSAKEISLNTIDLITVNSKIIINTITISKQVKVEIKVLSS